MATPSTPWASVLDRGCMVPRRRIRESQPPGESRAMVSALTPEERDFQRCQEEIAGRRQRVAALQTQLAQLKASLDRFATLCQARLGDLLDELRRVTREIGKYERNLERLRTGAAEDLTAPADDETEAFSWWSHDTEESTSHPSENEFDHGRHHPLSDDAAAEVKRLYIELAKRCHPDLATSGEERRAREALMQRVNEAFRDRDLAALRAIQHESEASDPRFSLRPVRDRLVWARSELARLSDQVADLRAQISALRAGDAYGLWRRYESGGAIFETLEDDLEARIVAERRRLDALIAAHRQLVDEPRETSVATG